MWNHHFHQSARPFTILLFYYFISIRFQAEVFASRVAKPECRTTIFTSRPHRLLFYYFISIRFQEEVFASRVANPECRTTIFTGRPAVFASRVAKPECLTTIFTSRPDAFSRVFFASRTAFFACRLTFLHVGQTYPPKPLLLEVSKTQTALEDEVLGLADVEGGHLLSKGISTPSRPRFWGVGPISGL